MPRRPAMEQPWSEQRQGANLSQGWIEIGSLYFEYSIVIVTSLL